MDIIFFAAVAFFIFFKLSKQLGKIDDEQKKKILEMVEQQKQKAAEAKQEYQQRTQQQGEKIVGSASTKTNLLEEKILNSLDSATKENFVKILQYGNITAEFFVNGAKSAFEMVVKAFASADLSTLKILLSDKIYQGFESAISHRKSEEKTLTTNLISVDKAEIISAMVLENIASVTVKFSSKQINYVIDKEGKVVEGTKDEIAELNDIWTFKKDLMDKNPNWVVVTTGS